jgi:EAL domain-containing protein (putative c-di-GMP-specific phosphodiesterase class I)
LEWLRSRGCNEAQGFLLSRSLSAKDLENRYLLAADAQELIASRI